MVTQAGIGLRTGTQRSSQLNAQKGSDKGWVKPKRAEQRLGRSCGLAKPPKQVRRWSLPPYEDYEDLMKIKYVKSGTYPTESWPDVKLCYLILYILNYLYFIHD